MIKENRSSGKQLDPSRVSIHKQEWELSAVDPDIFALNVVSYEPLSFESNYNYELEQADVYGQLLYAAPRSWYNNNGILKSDKLRDYKHLEKGGWWCSGVNILTGEDAQWGCFKPNEPRTNYDGKIIKYEVPPKVSTEIFALKISEKNWENIAKNIGIEKTGDDFWRWVLNDATIPLFITEGAKKAGSLLTAGYPTISLPGINNILTDNRLNPFIEAFVKTGREIYICFDQDVKYKTRQNTYKAIQKLGEILENLGCKVKVIVWDKQLGKGVDDLIYDHGKEKFGDAVKGAIAIEDYLAKNKQTPQKLNDRELVDFIKSELGSGLRFNQLKGRVEYKGEPFEIEDSLRFQIVEDYGYSITSKNIADAIAHVAKKRAYHPIKEYLSKVEETANSIDIDNLASRYFGTNDPLYNILLKKWLIAAVARVFKPGCKADNALILHGGQGIGKSTFFEILGGEGFDASVEDFNSKDSKLSLHKCWIQELAEFERINSRNTAEKIKQFMALRMDNFRKPYAYEACDYKRQFIFCGSVNKTEFLMDETGSRRFWVISIPNGHYIPVETLEQERDSIWSAAVKAYKSGERWWLTKEQELTNSENNKTFEYEDPWQGEIEKYISNWETVYPAEILSNVFKIEPSLQNKNIQMRVTGILTKLGWVKGKQKRIAGKAVVMWHKLKSEEKVLTGVDSNNETHTPPSLEGVNTFSPKKEGGVDSNSETYIPQGLEGVNTFFLKKEGGVDNNTEDKQASVNTSPPVNTPNIEVLTPSNPDTARRTETLSTPVNTFSPHFKNKKTEYELSDEEIIKVLGRFDYFVDSTELSMRCFDGYPEAKLKARLLKLSEAGVIATNEWKNTFKAKIT